MKFVIFVEGYTGKKSLPDFRKRWLDYRLPEPVGIKTVRFEGCNELWREAPRRARLYLHGPDSNEIIGVISLLDLYGPAFYPENLTSAQKRYRWAKAEMEKNVDHPKFRQFFAVHETEAWLLSKPEIFPAAVRAAVESKTGSPESVDFDEPPAKLIQRLYREKLKQTYKKVTHGKQLFDKLDPADAYKKCSRLKEMLDEMLELATAAHKETGAQHS